jgi:hypothetical protein
VTGTIEAHEDVNLKIAWQYAKYIGKCLIDRHCYGLPCRHPLDAFVRFLSLN